MGPATLKENGDATYPSGFYHLHLFQVYLTESPFVGSSRDRDVPGLEAEKARRIGIGRHHVRRGDDFIEDSDVFQAAAGGTVGNEDACCVDEHKVALDETAHVGKGVLDLAVNI